VRVVVLSDTHMPTRAKALPRALLDDLDGADLILHAGDFATVDVLNMLRLHAPVHAVYGNVDEPELRRVLPRRAKVAVGGKTVGLVHGDSPSLPTVQRAQAEFVDEAVDAIVFGHSHRPLLRREDGVLLFNPGSPTDRRAQPRFSFGRMWVDDAGVLQAAHVWIDP
jgi:putative phosphoesterase